MCFYCILDLFSILNESVYPSLLGGPPFSIYPWFSSDKFNPTQLLLFPKHRYLLFYFLSIIVLLYFYLFFSCIRLTILYYPFFYYAYVHLMFCYCGHCEYFIREKEQHFILFPNQNILRHSNSFTVLAGFVLLKLLGKKNQHKRREYIFGSRFWRFQSVDGWPHGFLGLRQDRPSGQEHMIEQAALLTVAGKLREKRRRTQRCNIPFRPMHPGT